MEITLLNYKNDKCECKLPDLASFPVVEVLIHVVYGDEHIEVIAGDEPVFDFASDHAIWSGGYDGSYTVYSRNGDTVEFDLLSNPSWVARKDSYEFLYKAIDEMVEPLMNN